jgi:phytoene synthase
VTPTTSSAEERAAYRACEAIARAHEENFPVASWLLPREARRHLAAFYAFARRADDWADEPGRGDAATRRAALARLRASLEANPAAGVDAGSDGPAGPAGRDPVFVALAASRRDLALGPELFARLLDAFERDLDQPGYDTWDDLLSYCRDSAEPVGRLVLAAVGDRDEDHGAMSDAICTALQLTNFWQDLSRDEPRGRSYLPRAERARFGDAKALAYAVARTGRLFDDGAPLARLAPAAARPYLRAVLAGGRSVLARVSALGPRAFRERPFLGALDRARIAARALGGAAAADSSFAAAFGLLPKERREALAALHAFCRHLDDLIDDAPDADTARAGWMRALAEVTGLGDHREAPPSAAARRMHTAWRSFPREAIRLRDDGLAALVTGLLSDATGSRPATDEELSLYCRAVGGGPGIAALPVFGCDDAALDFALELGTALQRTNVLRDVASDARVGRCYVPADDLARAGLAPEDLAGTSPPAGFRALALLLARRARDAFARARAAMPPGAERDLAPALAMARAYEHVLSKIEADPARVFRERVRVSPWRAAWLALGARAAAKNGRPA